MQINNRTDQKLARFFYFTSYINKPTSIVSARRVPIPRGLNIPVKLNAKYLLFCFQIAKVRKIN